MDGYVKICDTTTWHPNEFYEQFTPDVSCAVLVNTNSDNCNNYCEGNERHCFYAEENIGDTCEIADANTQTTSQNGCL